MLVPGALGCQSDARLSYIRLPSDLVEVGMQVRAGSIPLLSR